MEIHTGSGRKELKCSKICMDQEIHTKTSSTLARIESVCIFRGGLSFERPLFAFLKNVSFSKSLLIENVMVKFKPNEYMTKMRFFFSL